MSSSTSDSKEMEEDQLSQLSSRASGDEQYLSFECDERYNFRQTTMKQRNSWTGNVPEDFEADSVENIRASTRDWKVTSTCVVDGDIPSEGTCDVGSLMNDSMGTPTTCSTKRKNSFVASSNQVKKRKIVLTSAHQSFSSTVTTYSPSGRNKTWIPHLTIVKPFNFMTDGRIKSTQPKKSDKDVDFVSSLRRCSPRSNQKFKPKTTKPKPFSFDVQATGGHKQQIHDQETVNKAPKQQPHLVIPRSPKLHAVTRHRPITVLSREQIEEMEVEEMKKWKFHAKPVNAKLFTSAGIPKLVSKPSTKPEGIELQTQKRFQGKTKLSNNSPEKFEFHAQPIPKNIFKEPSGLKKKVQIPLTEPKSPQFTVRTRKEKAKENSLMEVSMSRVQQMPKPSLRARKLLPPPVPEKLSTTFEKRCTEIQPFSFEENDKIRFEKKKAKIEKALEKEKMVYEFKANPMPVPGNSPSGLPAVRKKNPTKPQPFKLRVEQIAEKKAQKLNEIENKLYVQTRGTAFKANPATVIHKPAFQLQKSTRPLTEINEFQLHTDKRAVEWHEMEEVFKSRNTEYEAVREQLNKEKERKEKAELALLRQQAVHKANPVRHYKPIAILGSDKPLTEPRSPQFATSKRMHRV